MGENYFHLKCRITRKGSDYGLIKETVTSSLHLVLAKADAEFLFIGSSPKSHIHIRGIEPQQASLMLSNAQITVEALVALDLVTKKGVQKPLKPGERVRLSLDNRAKWDLVFPNQTSIKCTVYDEMHAVPPEMREALEIQYGPLQKIWESQTFLTFKTGEGKVLKVLQSTFTKNKKIATRFEKAAKSFQKLPADSFVKINKVVNDAKTSLCYAEMDYLEGELLGNYMAKRGVVPPEEATAIVKDIAQKLAILQDHGYSVRNLQPYNIIRCPDGTMRILGFFLLKDYSMHMTQESDQMVIPNYSSPEQLQRPSLVDIYSDIYSLGVIFYSLLIGEPPIGGNNINEYVFQLSSAEPITAKKIQETAPKIPAKICKMLASMLSFDKGQRLAPRQVVSMLSSDENIRLPGEKGKGGFLAKVWRIFRK